MSPQSVVRIANKESHHENAKYHKESIMFRPGLSVSTFGSLRDAATIQKTGQFWMTLESHTWAHICLMYNQANLAYGSRGKDVHIQVDRGHDSPGVFAIQSLLVTKKSALLLHLESMAVLIEEPVWKDKNESIPSTSAVRTSLYKVMQKPLM